MGLLDEWNKVKNNENNKKERTKFALTQGAPKTQGSYFPNNGRSNVSSNIMNPESGQSIAERQAGIKKTAGDFDKQNRNILPPGWRERNAAITAQQEEQALMDGLMQRIGSSYEPMMPPGGNSSANADIMARLTGQLDQALSAKLGAIGKARESAQQGYNTSDSNLAAMFGANANHIATQGSQRFGEIAQTHQAGINQQREQSLAQLKADRDEAMARRTEMLNRLGIQAAGAQTDPGEETLNNAITATTNRADMALQGSQQANATNQAYNQSVVNSVNQQGTERRAALMQQLRAIQDQLGMAEAEAQDQNVQAKNQLEMQRMQSEAEAASQSYADYNKFGYQQFRDDRNLAFDLYKTLTGQKQAGAEEQAPRIQGYAGLAQDLVNQGIPEAQAGQYMGALSQVLGSEYMQGIHPDEGYDRASVIARRLMEEMRVPPAIAAQLATNYANLGNNAYYTQQ